MNLTDLRTLLDNTNGELLLGNQTPIHTMDKDELEALIRRIEALYKACIKIKISKSLRSYNVGLDFSKYEQQEAAREAKLKDKRAAKVVTEGAAASRKPKAKGPVTIELPDMIKSMLAGFCATHQKLKKECGCE